MNASNEQEEFPANKNTGLNDCRPTTSLANWQTGKWWRYNHATCDVADQAIAYALRLNKIMPLDRSFHIIYISFHITKWLFYVLLYDTLLCIILKIVKYFDIRFETIRKQFMIIYHQKKETKK